MCIQARKLFDIVRLLPDEDVHFKKEENEWVKLNCGKSKFRLAGVSRDQFPEVPEFKSAPMNISADVFNHFIHNTSFAITNEQSRFTLSGAKFVIENGMARMVTTDAHRLAFIETQIPELSDAAMDALIPKKALTELVRVSKNHGGSIKFGDTRSDHIPGLFGVIALDRDHVMFVAHFVMRVDISGHLQKCRHLFRRYHRNLQGPACIRGSYEAAANNRHRTCSGGSAQQIAPRQN